MEEANDLSGVLNMKKYPIENMESQEYKELLENARAMFKKDGIVTFPQFLLPEAVDTTVREIEKKNQPHGLSSQVTMHFLMMEMKDIPLVTFGTDNYPQL